MGPPVLAVAVACVLWLTAGAGAAAASPPTPRPTPSLSALNGRPSVGFVHATPGTPGRWGRGRGGGSREEALRVCMQGKPPATAASSVLSFLCPVLKLLSNTDPTAPRNPLFESLSVSLSTASRPLWGREASPVAAAGGGLGGGSLPVLYEFEACPFCRRVRETLTYLDIDVEVRPCPKGSTVHRKEVLEAGGKEAFPFLRDGNTGREMYESGDIVDYLVETYGGGAGRPPLLLESTLISGWVPTIARGGRGMMRWQGAKEAPAERLVLFSVENEPGSRVVREALCELELPYQLVNVGLGSARGKAQLDAAGGREVPFLVDPSQGVSLSGADAINSHLFGTYTLPVEQ